MQTASGTAESDVSGVYMNMVTKSGGNRFNSDHNFYFMNDALQGEQHRRRAARSGSDSAGAADGRRRQPDQDLVRLELDARRADQARQAWFFGALRWWRLDQFQIGALNPDGSQGDRRQPHPQLHGQGDLSAGAEHARVVHVQPQPEGSLPSPRSATFSEDKATVLQDQPAQNYVAQLNQVFGKATLFDARFGRMWGVFPTRYQKEVTAERHRHSRHRCATRRSTPRRNSRSTRTIAIRPTRRWATSPTASAPGTHDFKVGAQLSWERMAVRSHPQRRSAISSSTTACRSARSLSNTPINSDHRLETWARLRAGSLDGRAARPSTTVCASTA